jgi:S-adenosylmethionine hydrolase
VSKTFHGRDIFAPVASWLTKSWQSSAFGEAITDFARFALPKPKTAGNTIKGVVLRVDQFGNLITNLRPEDVPAFASADGKFTIRVGNAAVTKLAATFANGAAGEVIGFIGSGGYLEISVNKANASKTLGLGRGAEVTVEVG